MSVILPQYNFNRWWISSKRFEKESKAIVGEINLFNGCISCGITEKFFGRHLIATLKDPNTHHLMYLVDCSPIQIWFCDPCIDVFLHEEIPIPAEKDACKVGLEHVFSLVPCHPLTRCQHWCSGCYHCFQESILCTVLLTRTAVAVFRAYTWLRKP